MNGQELLYENMSIRDYKELVNMLNGDTWYALIEAVENIYDKAYTRGQISIEENY